jgi:hypothetical protein
VYFPYHLTIQLTVLPYFPYFFTIQLTFLPYFPNLYTIQLTFLPYFPSRINLGKSANIERENSDLKESLETMKKRYGTYGRKLS